MLAFFHPKTDIDTRRAFCILSSPGAERVIDGQYKSAVLVISQAWEPSAVSRVPSPCRPFLEVFVAAEAVGESLDSRAWRYSDGLTRLRRRKKSATSDMAARVEERVADE